ncbi:hypothetical protein NW760_001414 [Fusarium oxysporum]|nr:hypothetical protein NW760_001414 [Fusarium oxysporum]
MRSLVFVGVCLPLISGSPVDIPRSDLSPRLVTSIEQASCGVVGYKPDPILTRSLKCRLVDCQELCSATAGCQSYAQSSARCRLFSSPVAEGFQQDSTSPFTYYDIDCSTPMTSSTETLPEFTDSVTTELSTSGTEVTATSNPLPSSTTATCITEISTELTSAYPESASTSVSSDITSTAITLRSNTETTTTGDATTIAAGESTTATSSTPTVYIIRLVNPDESTFGYVSTAPGHNRLSGPKEEALEIRISAPEPGATSQLDFVHAETFGGLTRLCAVQSTHNANADLGPDSSFYNYLSTCTPSPPGSPPAYFYHAWTNWAELHRYTLAAESAIWIVKPDTLEVTASWINTDGSAPPTTLFIPETSNWIGMTGSMSALQAAFPNQPYRRIKLVLEPIS